MSLWNKIKNILKRILPPGRAYFQQEFEKSRKEIKALADQEKKLQVRMDKQAKEIRQFHIEQEILRKEVQLGIYAAAM